MGTKTVRFSDLTNKIIDDDAVVRVVIEQHPDLHDGPVEIEVDKEEAEAIRQGNLNVVSLRLYQGDGSAPESVTMEIESFNGLAQGMDIADVIRRAGPAYPPRKTTANSSHSSSTEKVDYTSMEHAGTPHRGKTTEAEKDTVRNNLDAVNERLKREGIRTIDLNNPEHVARYGLEILAKEAGRLTE